MIVNIFVVQYDEIIPISRASFINEICLKMKSKIRLFKVDSIGNFWPLSGHQRTDIQYL